MDEEKKTSKLSSFWVPLILVTLLSASGGAAHGFFIFQNQKVQKSSLNAPVAATKDAASSQPGSPRQQDKLPSKIVTREMPPLITNLLMPADMWIRLESTIVFDQADFENPDVIVAEVSGDLLAYLRSLTIREVQGAEGLMFLRQELKERGALRTKGRMKDIIIQALVVQ
jgi:flagellar FliL protein